MPRYFRLEEAEQLLPSVEQSLRQAVHLKKEHDRASDTLHAIVERVHMMGGVLLDREELLARRSRRDALGMRLKEVLEEIHNLGVQVKDLDTGLIDFPTIFRGSEVLLCWRLGEEGIGFWHGLDEGFRGRKPIDDEFRAEHRGDAP